jgi:hypothetical protein
MSLKKASGDGSTSRRFAKAIENGEEVKIPVTKDCATLLYLIEGDEWPKLPFLRINSDIFWIKEGLEFPIEDLAPGKMGKATYVRVVEMRFSIKYVQTKGMSTMGQAKRNVLLEIIEDDKDDFIQRRRI